MAITHDYAAVSPVARVLEVVAGAFRSVVEGYKARRAEAATRAELMRLTDAELADIGLNRYQIPTLDLSKNG